MKQLLRATAFDMIDNQLSCGAKRLPPLPRFGDAGTRTLSWFDSACAFQVLDGSWRPPDATPSEAPRERFGQ
jgi:hypothetical protein